MTAKIVILCLVMIVLMGTGIQLTGGISGLLLVGASFACGVLSEIFDEQLRNK